MSEEPSVDRRDFPLVAAPTMREVQQLLEEALSNILYEDGLDRLPQLALSLMEINHTLKDATMPVTGYAAQFLEVFTSIADRLSEIRDRLYEVREKLDDISEAV